MDAIEILTNIDRVFPHFQAVFNAEDQKIIGYEVFGRIQTNEGPISLGSFFLDDNVPEEYRLEVDQVILKMALEKALELDEDCLLFINRDADVLMFDNGEQLLALLLEYEEKGIALSRIVLESTERSFNGDMEHLNHLLNYLRTYGIKLAINKKGSDLKLMERLSQLTPNILKIDLNDVHAIGSTKTLQDILQSLSLLARKIGVSLLFENVETSYHLQFALKNGGRYFQGYYLHNPSSTFEDPFVLKEKLIAEFALYVEQENKKLVAISQLTDDFNARVNRFLTLKKKFTTIDDTLNFLAREFDGIAVRLYATDSFGNQLSANIQRVDSKWESNHYFKGKNWCWRPYFIENIKVMTQSKKGILSDTYKDLENLEEIRTFSFSYDSDVYIFIDISHDYLFENKGII